MRELNDLVGGNNVGISVKSAQQVLDEQIEEQEEKEAALRGPEPEEPDLDVLSSHVLKVFYTNRDSRRESGIEQDMLDDLYQVSGQYRPNELDEINGSNIFMNITATKQRAAKSWIKDIILPANSDPFDIVTSHKEEVPPEIKKMIYDALLEDEKRLSAEIEEKYQKLAEKAAGGGEEQKQQGPSEEEMAQMPPEQQQQIQAQMQQQEEANKLPASALIVSKKLKEISKLRRDVEESIMNEIHKVANNDARRLDKCIKNDLQKSGFEDKLDQFIDDFTTFPTAFLKGPIVTTEDRLTWNMGEPTPVEMKVFKDYRLNPLDAYPSPGADSIYDGDFIEHLRISPKELAKLAKLDKDTTGYIPETIIEILEEEKPGSPFWLSSDIEEDKARIEKRGSQTYANTDIYHGLHFWGSINVSTLREWGLEDIELIGRSGWEHIEVEVMMVSGKVVKCRLNKDPLKRRPYYAACFHPRNGSIWGRSLPSLMRDIQGMCNASARALADNMGMASGPQMAILVDRLADDGDIEEQEPFKIWQFRSDPQGNGGKPVEYFIAPSNAKELLAVYETFEVKADDVTGVPRYAYGNERTGGAGQTASGLSMLLESASKGIKSAVMNIARGLIIPRVEFQSYLFLLNMYEKEDEPMFKWNGDLNVTVRAIENITIRAAQQQLRKELLQVTSNPQDIKIMGYEGRGLLLKEIFKDVNLPEDAIPDRLELKEIQARDDANEQKMIDSQASKQSVGLEATKAQVEGQMSMHEKSLQVKIQELEKKFEDQEKNRQIKLVELEQRNIDSARREAGKIEDSKRTASTKIAIETVKAKQKEDEKEYERRLEANKGPTEEA
jgi:hypothetical protein